MVINDLYVKYSVVVDIQEFKNVYFKNWEVGVIVRLMYYLVRSISISF